MYQETNLEESTLIESSVTEILRRPLREKNGMGISIYDSAFVVASEVLPTKHQDWLIKKILNERQEDYTWGEGVHIPHSTVLNTLAVAWAFEKLGIEIPDLDKTSNSLDEALARCRNYPHHRTVAFEFLAPLMSQSTHSISLNEESTQYLGQLFEEGVLAKIGQNGKNGKNGEGKGTVITQMMEKLNVYDKTHSLSFTAELALFIPFFTAEAAKKAYAGALTNSSIGLSPAATAATLILVKEKLKDEDRNLDVERALSDYLKGTYHDYLYEGFPGVHPYENMKHFWYALPWMLSGEIDHILQTQQGRNALKEMYERTRFDERGRRSWDPHNMEMWDLDDTSVGQILYLSLRKAGVKDIPTLPFEGMLDFRGKNGVFCYKNETHPSPVALMHAVKAIELATEVYGREFGEIPEITDMLETMLTQIVDMDSLEDDNKVEHLCHDKWHATWTYGFERWTSIKTIVQRYPQIVKKMISFANERQQEDGGWGEKYSTMEETSYVISGLSKTLEFADEGLIELSQEEKFSLIERIISGGNFIEEAIADKRPEPALWIAKTPYRPAWADSAIKHGLEKAKFFKSLKT